MDDESETLKLWKIRITVMEMCRARGYLVEDDEINQSLNEFKKAFGDKPSHNKPGRSDLTILVAQCDDPDDKMYIFFPEDAKIGVGVIRDYGQRLQSEQVKRAVLVIQGKMTPSASAAMASLAPTYIIQCFTESELVTNVTKHCLVPEHIVLTPAEKEKVLKKYKLKDYQLNRIYSHDAVSKFFGLQRGQVVMIRRPCENDDPNSEEKGSATIAYRVVV